MKPNAMRSPSGATMMVPCGLRLFGVRSTSDVSTPTPSSRRRMPSPARSSPIRVMQAAEPPRRATA